MQQLKAIPPRATTNRNTYLSDDLHNCSHVFVRHDAISKPLQQPYDGPFPVIKCTDKHFTVHMNNCDEVVTIDTLKPAYMDTSVTSDPLSSTNNVTPTTIPETSTPSSPSSATCTTQSSRLIHWPKRLCNIDAEGEYCS